MINVFSYKSFEEKTITNTMNADIGTEACTTVEGHIKARKDVFVSKNTTMNDRIRPSVACLALFSDKSLLLICAGSFQFYPPHVTLLKFVEERQR